MRILLYLLLTLFLASCSSSKRLSKSFYNNFNEAETKLILAEKSDVPMRVFLITDPKDSVLLRTKSQPVQFIKNDTILPHFTKRLLSTVQDPATQGVGIAAPQVGILKNIIWIQRFDKPNRPFEVYYNPQIDKYTELKQTVMEGCLSIPEIQDSLSMRAYAILLQYDNPKGEHICEMIEDFTAVIFQHEIDHLNGILFTDHLAKEKAASGKHDLD